jgi:hypothetical protein
VNCLSENQAVIQPLVTLVDINKRDVIPIAGFILDNYFHAKMVVQCADGVEAFPLFDALTVF